MTQKSDFIRTRTNPLSPEELAEMNAPFTEAQLEAIELKQSIKAGRLVLLTELSKWAEQVVERSSSRKITD